MAMAGKGRRFLRKRPVSSSAKCMASHKEPPFPQLIILPPCFIAEAITSTISLMLSMVLGWLKNCSKVLRASVRLWAMICFFISLYNYYSMAAATDKAA